MNPDRSGWTRTGAARLVLVALVAAGLVVAAPAPPVAADANETAGASLAFRSIVAGSTHTCALLRDASVKCWGANGFGQLGQGDTANRGDSGGQMGDALHAIPLGSGRTAAALAAGENHTCALLDNGTVRCWGANANGQLGLGDTQDRGDDAGEMGNTLPTVSLGTGRTATAITGYGSTTCALLDNGTVKCWGANSNGQLGQGDTAKRGDGAGEMGNNLPPVSLGTGRTATAVSAGDGHTCVTLDDRTVKCWGLNASGQLGQGDAAARGDAAGEMGDALPTVNLGTGRTATGLSARGLTTCALLENATVKCWGANGNGRLGLGDTANRGDGAGEMGNSLPIVSLGTGRTATAVTAGRTQTCARLDTGAMKCWGGNDFGQLGGGGTFNQGDGAGEMGDNLPTVDLGDGRTATAVSSGGSHNCALLDNGTVRCWGLNSFGQLGLGNSLARGDGAGEMGDNLPTVALGAGRTATSIASNGNHTCALLDNGTVRCWGLNASGRLGLGDTADRGDNAGEMGDSLPSVSLGTGRTATAIAAGSSHTCALLDNATVKCWGANTNGQLGLGDTASRGDGAGEMGDSLPTVSLGTGRTATAIAAGNSYTCALLDNATVKCWGRNGSGRLGLGDTADRGDTAGEMGNSLPTVSLGTGRTAAALTAGTEHTCALLDDATVKCWGENDSGRLGLGDTADRGDTAGEMGNSLPTVSLGTGRTATTVSADSAHTCAVLDNDTVKCWGSNTNGRLGLGDTLARGDAAGEMGNSLPTVSLGTARTATTVSAGSQHTCALLDNATVKCWGVNSSGELGLGDNLARGDAAGEMGDSLAPVDLGSAALSGISGTITDAGSGARVAGAFVVAMRPSDFSIAGGAVADSGGNYSVELPPGGYFLYLIDPGDRHTAAFFGAPAIVTATSPGLVDADPTMAPTRGTVTATVTEEGTGTPIAGAMVLTLSGSSGLPERGVVANGSGVASVPDLRAGTHFVGLLDPSGNHVTEFHPNSPNVPDATPVPVTGGGSTPANGALATQAATPAGVNLTGTITETGTGSPLADVFVIALHAADFRLARATVTNASGAYTLNVQAGAYKLAFVDATGLHHMEWHNNQPAQGIGAAASVNAPATTNASLDPSTGSLSGTITDEATAAPLPGAWVFAIGPTGLAGGTVTALNGTYRISGLPPGTYRVTIVDPSGDRLQEYFDDSADFAGATLISVIAGSNFGNINAALSG